MSIYPTAIPTITDYPERTDAIDDVDAIRYNEIKNEFLALCAELGISPSGEYETVKARLDAGGGGAFVDRGDSADHDWNQGDLTTDGDTHELDLSGIIPEGTTAVVLTGWLRDTIVGAYIYFRQTENDNIINVAACRVQANNIPSDFRVILAVGSDRKIKYTATDTTFSAIEILVAGWFI